ncbi:peptide/nickel transport system permease protein [Cocleimonas flava]|uniref:Peptide/nickel transport system permease protein n=2 Tax=Thiotrichaceae TaxID=135617 RepID=A0A4R1F715_9GAMM|nr:MULTISPECIES: ABC transporter permease [unclassified Cocleimonas]MEC4745467.1 ABC transporter permease [Cocleimonas sp. KMM 6896]TCJ87758.1 peptide/nickel transport system permease protein [Cocleimonas flava]
MNKPTEKVKHRSSGFLRRVLKHTFSGWGAKIGLMWVGILVIAAVFAPFLANSMPLLVSLNGEISAPVFRYLSVEDIVVLIAFFVLILLFLSPLRHSIKSLLLFFLIIIVGSTIVSKQFVTVQQNVVYSDFREDLKTTNYDWVVMPPIPYAPEDYLRDSQATPLEAPLENSEYTHWMGTEENGGDVLSRMIHASRIALGIGFIATGIAMVIGVILGGLMGYFSGIVDMLGMRLVEIFESIPTLFLLLTFVAFFGRSIYIMMVIIGLTSWSGYARYIRAEFLRLRKMDFVQATIASGLPLRSILFRHMLPNGIAPLLVGLSFGVASAILAEAMLSFLGLGLVGAPSWGQMLNQAVQSSTFNWWMAVYPGGAIFLTVFAYNLMGEALRDAIDPQLAKKAGVVG